MGPSCYSVASAASRRADRSSGFHPPSGSTHPREAPPAHSGTMIAASRARHRGSTPRLPNDPDADHQHDDAPEEEAEVVEQLIGTRSNVMQVQELMVDQAFDGVEEAPADEHAADERGRAAFLVPRPVRRHQNEHADDRDDPGGRMEDAVTERVQLQVLDGIGRHRSADHVVPLEDLMQDDAVEESTEPDAQEDGGDDEPRAAWLAVHVLG